MRSGLKFVAGCVLAMQAIGLQAAKSYDVLDLPAVQSPLAAHALVYSLTRAGDRIIATGIRGHILYSDDFGHSWTQADSVPVRSALLDAHFPTPEKGWVVGHEGVILHSTDGGRNWVRQLDGRQLATSDSNTTVPNSPPNPTTTPMHSCSRKCSSPASRVRTGPSSGC
jgi:photosystem II stability/assembly factor-like uncharacterized protein